LEYLYLKYLHLNSKKLPLFIIKRILLIKCRHLRTIKFANSFLNRLHLSNAIPHGRSIALTPEILKTLPVYITNVVLEKPVPERVIIEKPYDVPVEKVIPVPIEKIIHKTIPVPVPMPHVIYASSYRMNLILQINKYKSRYNRCR